MGLRSSRMCISVHGQFYCGVCGAGCLAAGEDAVLSGLCVECVGPWSCDRVSSALRSHDVILSANRCIPTSSFSAHFAAIFYRRDATVPTRRHETRRHDSNQLFLSSIRLRAGYVLAECPSMLCIRMRNECFCVKFDEICCLSSHTWSSSVLIIQRRRVRDRSLELHALPF